MLNKVNFQNLDVAKWNRLVDLYEGYGLPHRVENLRLLHSDWVFIIQDDYEAGMAMAVKNTWGQPTVFTPKLFPFSVWLGANAPKWDELQNILSEIRYFNFFLKGIPDIPRGFDRVYQITLELRTNARLKKKLEKAAEAAVVISASNEILSDELYWLIAYLKNLHPVYDKDFEITFKEFCRQLMQENRLVVYRATKDQELMGILLTVSDNGWSYSLKSALHEHGKEYEVMSALQHQAINDALKAGKKVDFGGSNLSGVRQFYRSLGGVDEKYQHLVWVRRPLWLKVLLRVKRILTS